MCNFKFVGIEDSMRSKLQYPNTTLIFVLFLLISIGLIVLFSASYPRARILFDDAFYFAKRQALLVLVGAALGVGVILIPLEFLRQASPFLMLGGILFLCLPLVPGIGIQFLGARRWIAVSSVTLQPSEFIRFPLVLYLAHMIAKKKNRMQDFFNGALPLSCVIALVTVIIYVQNDFSTMLFVFVVSFSILCMGGLRLRHIAAFFIASIPPMAVFLFTREYRVRRLLSYFFPEIDVTGAGYQSYVARNAIARGGLFGLGIGQSVSKHGVLPEAHSDFLAAVIAEEYGFLGIAGVCALFAFFGYCGYRIALQAQDEFVALAAFGITTFVVLQAFINLAVVSNVLPTTGLPLPFFSAGGSSMINSIILAAFLIKLSQQHDTAGRTHA